MNEECETPVGQDGPTQTTSDRTPEERVRDIFLTVQKALKLRRLYGPAGKICQATVDALVEKLTSYLEEHGDLKLTVTVDALVTGEDEHLRGTKRETSIPFKLFHDGIRSIRLSRGLTADEVGRFLAVLDFQPEGSGQYDEDMASVFWHQSFTHIEIDAVDEIGGPESCGTGCQTGGLSELSRGLDEMLQSLKSPRLVGGEAGSVERSGKHSGGEHLVSAGEQDFQEMDRLAASLSGPEASEDLFAVPEAVLEKLRSELDEDGTGALIGRVIEIVTDVFCEVQCTLGPAEVRGLMAQLFRGALASGDLAGLSRYLENLEAYATHHPDKPARELLDVLRGDLESKEAVDLLLSTAAAAGDPKSTEGLLKLLMVLPAPALLQCALRLRSLKPGPAREACLQVLRMRGHEDLSVLFAYLEQGGGADAVQSLSSVLTQRDVPGVAGNLRSLLQHEDERVRMNAVRVGAALSGSLRKSILEMALLDPSPKVRFVAFRSVEQTKDRGFIPLLRKAFEECGSEKESDEERVRVVHAIAALGGPQAVACLEETIGPRRFLRVFRRKWGHMARWRKAAVVSLQDIADESVRAFLADGTASWDAPFADACGTALTAGRSKEAP